MFAFKKVVSYFLMPLPLATMLIAGGVALLWLGKRERLARGLVTVALVGLLVMSSRVFSNALTSHLEWQSPAVLAPETGPSAPRFVAVLGGGHTADARLPPNDELGDASLARVIEGVRLTRALDHATLILSGPTFTNDEPEADIARRLAEAMGVPAGSIVTQTQNRDTEEEAVAITRVVGTAPFYLVTSAMHMPRALALFTKQGAHPIAAPANFYSGESIALTPQAFMPTEGALERTERALHEYIGSVWSRLRGHQ